MHSSSVARSGTRSTQVTLGLLLVVASLGCASWMPVLGGGASTSGGPEIRPDAPAEYDLLVAQLARSEGRLSDSVAAYERAVAKDEDSAYLHRKAAEALAISNRVEDALYHANRAYELDPDDRSTRLFLGQLYRLRRDVAGAERVLRDENGEPLDDSAAFLLYQIYLSTGRLPEALGTAEWWVATDPESLRARVALANAYQRLDRPREAEETLREALEQDPGNLRIYDALARSLRERGDRNRVAESAPVSGADPSSPSQLGTASPHRGDPLELLSSGQSLSALSRPAPARAHPLHDGPHLPRADRWATPGPRAQGHQEPAPPSLSAHSVRQRLRARITRSRGRVGGALPVFPFHQYRSFSP